MAANPSARTYSRSGPILWGFPLILTPKEGLRTISLHPLFGHFFGHFGFKFFVIFAVHFEAIEHVIRVVVLPALPGIAVNKARTLPLLILTMGGISQRRILNFRRSGKPAIDQMAREGAALPNGDAVLFRFNVARDRDELEIPRLGGRREQMPGNFLQRRTLFVIGALIDINVVEIPVAEGFGHAFAFGTLHELRKR